MKNYEAQQVEAAKKFKIKATTKKPSWVSDEQLRQAFQNFLKKMRNPTEVPLVFENIWEWVFCFPVFQGERVFDTARRSHKTEGNRRVQGVRYEGE